MESRPFGSTGLTTSVLGFGCASYWSHPRFDEREAVDLAKHAIGRGVRLLDTSPSYGAGTGERRLGLALREMTPPADLIISTKVGTYTDPDGRLYKDWTYDGMRDGLRHSQDRLGLDTIPLLYLHGPDAHALAGPLMDDLERLRSDGLYRHLGVNSDAATAGRALDSPSVAAVMVSFNILDQSARPVIEKARDLDKAFVAAAPLAHAALSWTPFAIRRFRDLWYSARLLRNYPRDILRARAVRPLLRRYNLSPERLALQFVLSQEGVSAAIFGSTRKAHLDANIAAAAESVPGGILDMLPRK